MNHTVEYDRHAIHATMWSFASVAIAVVYASCHLPPLNFTICEQYNQRATMAGRLAYGSTATAVMLLFRHGDTRMIRALMAAVTLGILYLIVSTRAKPDDSYLQFQSAGRSPTVSTKQRCVGVAFMLSGKCQSE